MAAHTCAASPPLIQSTSVLRGGKLLHTIPTPCLHLSFPPVQNAKNCLREGALAKFLDLVVW